MLRFFKAGLRTVVAQSNAEAVSASFFQLVLPPNVRHAFAWAEPPAVVAAACGCRGDAARCEHLEASIACFARFEAGDASAVLSFWSALADQASRCPSCRQWGLVVLQRLSRLCEARIPEVAYTDNPTKSTRPSQLAGSKRTLEDEDYKRAVTSKVIQEGRAETPSAFLRATGDHAGHAADGWILKQLANHRASSVLSAQEVRSCSLSADASRIGNPAEDVLAIAAWLTTPLLDFGSLPPPQVHNIPSTKSNMFELWLEAYDISLLPWQYLSDATCYVHCYNTMCATMWEPTALDARVPRNILLPFQFPGEIYLIKTKTY